MYVSCERCARLEMPAVRTCHQGYCVYVGHAYSWLYGVGGGGGGGGVEGFIVGSVVGTLYQSREILPGMSN